MRYNSGYYSPDNLSEESRVPNTQRDCPVYVLLSADAEHQTRLEAYCARCMHLFHRQLKDDSVVQSPEDMMRIARATDGPAAALLAVCEKQQWFSELRGVVPAELVTTELGSESLVANIWNEED